MRRSRKKSNDSILRARPPRRGVAVLFVLLLLSMTLGLSYATIRSQSTVLSIQRNSERRVSARQVAVTGMAMALKKMQTSAWAGVDTKLTGTLSTTERFEVTYTTGDPRLTTSSSDYADLPYRVTLLATGYATDASNAQCVSSYQVRTVVRLVPRQLSGEPADWAEMRARSLYQYKPGECWINSPCRIEGTARFQGAVELSQDIHWSDAIRSRFFTDLAAMRASGMSDWRPFSGEVEMPSGAQPALTIPLLTAMGVTTTNVAAKTAMRLTAPVFETYRLYPGGKVYSVQTIGRSLQRATYGPDPVTNPVGIFKVNGNVDVYDDVTIRGTVIILNADMRARGRRIRFEGVDLLPLHGSDTPVQLPATIAEYSFKVFEGAELSVDGMVTCNNECEFDVADQNGMQVVIQGGVVANDIHIAARSQWQWSSGFWTIIYNAFRSQEGDANGIRFFPDWLRRALGIDPTPRLTIKPPATAVRYHWQNATEPIYVEKPGDGGLRWELLDWTERL